MEPLQSWILLDTNNLLRESCTDLSIPVSKEDKEYIDRMVCYIDACNNHEDEKFHIRGGIALAGPQVGLTKNVIYINFSVEDKNYKYLLANPVIKARSLGMSYLKSGEGCLSVNKEIDGYVPRNKMIVVKAYDLLNKKPVEIKADGILSICLQHEIDHLHGILFYDHINKENKFYTNPNWLAI